MKSAFIN